MSGQQSSEILMQIIDNSGNPLAADTQTELDKDEDDLVFDYFNGTCFTVDNFSFGLKLDDSDSTTDTASPAGKSHGNAVGQSAQTGSQTPFGKWKSATSEEIRAMKPYKWGFDTFQVTRRFDQASPVLFQACARSTTFQSISMVKRKTVGGGMLQSFLRFDFGNVLITNVSWEDAEVIKETLEFLFRTVTVQYRRQAFDGTLNPAGSVTATYTTALRGK